MALDPTIIVLFGGAGDLVWRKLIPSLFDLQLAGRMPRRFAILAVDRLPFRDDDLHARFLGGVKQFARNKKVTTKDWGTFAGHVDYPAGAGPVAIVAGDFNAFWGAREIQLFLAATGLAIGGGKGSSKASKKD